MSTYKYREEIVGKRFLSVSGGFTKLKVGKISEWGWRAGVIRAASHKDNNHPELQVLVEYDDVEWHRREWISIYKDKLFHLFLVEQGLAWVDRRDPFAASETPALWPALTFASMVSAIEMTPHLQPVEFLLDRELAFIDYTSQLKPFQEWDPILPGVRDYPELRAAVRRWREQQDGQRILLTTPSVLVGYRVEVYRAEGTTQWYTAVIVGYNEATRDLTVTDDTVLEEHNEDPALVQMRLIGDGVVESIMRGENVGITARRSRSTVLQTQQHLQHQPSRVVRGLSSVTCGSATSIRKPRCGKPPPLENNNGGTSPEPPDKGSVKTRKRKASESETTTKLRHHSYSAIKEDLENKQSRKKGYCAKTSNSNGGTTSGNHNNTKKKVLEEATNSKLREVQVRVEDCLQIAHHQLCRRSSSEEEPSSKTDDSALEDDTSNGSSVQLVVVPEAEEEERDDPSDCRQSVIDVVGRNEAIVSEEEEEEEEEDCIIVAQRTNHPAATGECSTRVDDDGPLRVSSPYSRMDEPTVSSLRFPDDRSDSGVSSLRSGSGDERSGSRSSALSSSDEPPPPPHHHHHNPSAPSAAEPPPPVRVWRDPTLLLESEPHVRHIHSVQHRSLLMSSSHPSAAPAAAGPQPVAPNSSSAAAASHPAAALYAPVPPPPAIMTPHPLQHHHAHLGPPAAALYAAHTHHLTDMLWKQRYPLPVGGAPPHLLAQSGAHGAEDMLVIQDRERHERLMRERQLEAREIEKHNKEKERLERERLEREKLERDREREKQERERELEKERQEQALQNHFEKSLRAAQQKREQWNPISGRPPQQRTGSEEERKRMEQEGHQREPRHLNIRQERDHRAYYTTSQQQQRPASVPGKADYPPPPAHSRVTSMPSKSVDKMPMMHASQLPKTDLNMFGYPACQTYFTHEPKNKMSQSSDHHQHQKSQSLVMQTAKLMERADMVSSNPPPLISEVKNSVIVKHDAGKNSHQLAHSPSPKLRTDMMTAAHYLQPGQNPKGSLYDYRSPTQSPHHLQSPHTPSPHHHMMEPQQNLGGSKSSHRSTNQMPSPHHHHQQQQQQQQQRQSPHHQSHHPHAQQHPSPELRYRTSVSESQAQAMIYPTGASKGYPGFMTTSAYSLSVNSVANNSKPKVSSPAPHQLYGKPSVPIGRESIASSAPIQLTPKAPLASSISPSPYQQVSHSQYHPPHHPQTAPNVLPPPAHSRTPDPRYDRMYAVGPSAGGVKVSLQHGTSPPTAASAPPVARSHPQYMPGVTMSSSPLHTMQGAPSVQTQPLDLGVSNKYDPALSPKRRAAGPPSSASPVCLEVKKRRVDTPQPQPIYVGQPQLARVSEPSPLIASAATTITTVVNTAAYRTAAPEPAPHNSVNSVNLSGSGGGSNSVSASSADCVASAGASETNTGNAGNGGIQQQLLRNAAAISPLPTIAQAPTDSSETTTSSPVKLLTIGGGGGGPGSVDSDKSNSPGPAKSTSYPVVRHLKKAWLQRHTGEDVEDNTGVQGSGSCVTLPITMAASAAATAAVVNNATTVSGNNSNKENPMLHHTLHSVGSMAVNSISKTKHFGGKANNSRKTASKEVLNGDASKADDSSSSDQDRGRKSPPKRKPPKVKRKKGGGGPSSKKNNLDEKKQQQQQQQRKPPTTSSSNQSAAAPPVVSDSGSDSEKESGSDKDSDSGASTKKMAANGSGNTGSTAKEPRKRGRRPKSSKNDKGEEPRSKKSKEDNNSNSQMPQRDPFRKPPVGQLKKTGESFLQDGPCFEVAPKLAKCRECRWTPNQRSKNMPNIFCRFYAFRRLRYTKNGQLAIAGFSDPHKDALEDDLKLWLPNVEAPPADLDLDTSRFILRQVGDHFCDLLVQEKEAHVEYVSDDRTVAWKRVVQGVREMCDVCETTLFNFHWACGKCGFVVCLDCYKSRKSGSMKVWGEPGKDRDECSWLLCTNRQGHEQEKLMLTQIIAGDSLQQLGKLVHEMRELWNIEQFCGCALSKEVAQKSNNLVYKDIIKNILSENKVNGIKKEIKEENDSKALISNGISAGKDEKTSPLSWLADVALSNEDKKNDDNSTSDSDEGNFSTLRELLIRPSHKPNNGSRAASPVVVNNQKNNNNKKIGAGGQKLDTLDEVISSVIEDSVPRSDSNSDMKPELKHFLRRYNWHVKGRSALPIRIMTLTESKLLYPDVPHSWLCDGKLLRLSDAVHKDNYKIFQDQWKRGQPVIVSDVTRNLTKDLWNPEAFARDFGDEKNDLINCMNGNLVPNQPMRKFWDGFDHFSKRLKDDRGNPMLLKLKDWPPGEDFAEMLPTRFTDLMKVLPLSEYTHRSGRLNLASRLPDCFVRPDLGPKMYNAYGSALHPSKGTTNLHLDISDAVNVMVYVGIPKDGDSDEHIKEAFRAIDEAGCDILTRRRVRDKGELPGALWHIYNARDADKIRDLLNKVVVEKGGRLEPHHDPIHDQSCYLDGPLRERLYKEYGVEGYAIVQCLGDAVFIPAGAPHQVRNLHNCIKVAEDFVSPENVSHCFHLTQEFRDLSDTHSNHEDKLQIKNIIYHGVKDALSCIRAVLNRHVCKSEKEEESSSAERNGGKEGERQSPNVGDSSDA